MLNYHKLCVILTLSNYTGGLAVIPIKYCQASYIDPELQTNPCLITSIHNAAPLHTHDYYEFFLIISGSCLHHVNGKEQYLDKGALVFIRPEDVHSYSYYGSGDCQFINIPCGTRIIHSTIDYLGNAFRFSRLLETDLPEVTLLPSKAIDDFIARYEKIMMLATINKPQARLNLMNLIVEIFVQYFSSNGNNKAAVFPLWFESLLTEMQKKENFINGLRSMRKISGRSAGHLNRVFKQYLNATPTGYINSLRLNYARMLLATTGLNATEVCFEAGFGNLSHFYHLFKRSCDISPLEFREKMPYNEVSDLPASLKRSRGNKIFLQPKNFI